jgi:hypothetical protein
MRCINAKRSCGGFDDAGLSGFRLYKSPVLSQSSFITAARKCTMPKRVPLPGTNFLPADVLPVEISQAESNERSLRAFFYDYCIMSANSNLSRSYLPGLEMLTYRLGLTSNLVRACQAVSFATHGKPLNKPKLVEKASMFYMELLRSLATVIQNPAAVNAAETKFIIMLLGIHQVKLIHLLNCVN